MEQSKTSATDKKSFILYTDFLDTLNHLSDEQAGIVFKAIFHWQLYGHLPELDITLKLVLTPVVSQFKRDNAKYTAICLKRSIAGSLGAKQKLAKAGKRKQNKQVPANQADNDSDNDSDNVNKDIPPNPQRGSGIDYSDFLLRFNEASGKKCRVVDSKTHGQLKARMREGFTLDEIISAVRNCAADQYHMENPKYLTPEFITRADKLQKFLNADVLVVPKKERKTYPPSELLNDIANNKFEDDFKKWHGMSKAEFAVIVRRDLADLKDSDFGRKYKRTAVDARELLSVNGF